jgi:hypothetical protein
MGDILRAYRSPAEFPRGFTQWRSKKFGPAKGL